MFSSNTAHVEAVIIPWLIIIDFLLVLKCILIYRFPLINKALLATTPRGRWTKSRAKVTGLDFSVLVSLHRYFIDRHTDLERQFNINVDDGKITLAKPLDRETDMWHNITVTATEVGKYLPLAPLSLTVHMCLMNCNVLQVSRLFDIHVHARFGIRQLQKGTQLPSSAE